jgi:Na+/proline symporter
MRSLFVVFVVTLLAMVASFTLLESGDGYVLVALAGYTIEMPFLVCLLLFHHRHAAAIVGYSAQCSGLGGAAAAAKRAQPNHARADRFY